MTETIRLTQYSHGAGCGCKISPKVLDIIIAGSGVQNVDPSLWVGNASRDDAAVYAIDDDRGVVSTTDFFMPIVDDPFDFGRIAATNAISDIYAMGGTPLMAIAILGWPIDVLPPEVAREVIRGGRSVCDAAGIPLAGGHSIDAPEPIFGLAVTGIVEKRHMKRNDTATLGSRLYLTKPLGIGILTTAEKRAKLRPEDVGVARDVMCTLNKAGVRFGEIRVRAEDIFDTDDARQKVGRTGLGRYAPPAEDKTEPQAHDAGNGHRRMTAERRQRIENRQRVAGDQDAVRLHLRHPRERRVEHPGAGRLVGHVVVAAILEWPRVHIREADPAGRRGDPQALFEQRANGQPAKA